MSGKGDTPRPMTVDQQTYADNWTRTFNAAASAPVTQSPEFTIRPTGKFSLVLDLEGYGPMELHGEDFDVAMTLIRVVLDHSTDFAVSSYNDERAIVLQSLFA